MCIKHRRGQLCGECEEGYAVYLFHSENFLCGKCYWEGCIDNSDTFVTGHYDIQNDSVSTAKKL